MPLLSKICPVCGHVEEGGSDDNVSVDRFVQTLEEKLLEIKQLPHPSFGRSFSTITLIIFPVFAVMFLMVALLADAGMGWIFFGLFAVLSVRAFIMKGKGKIGNGAANKKFAALKNEYEYNARLAKRRFGKSDEVSGLLSDISGEMYTIEKERKAIASKNIIIWIIILALVGGLVTWGVMADNKSAKDPEQLSQRSGSRIEQQLEDYRAGGTEALGAEQKRFDIIDSMLAADKPGDAEKFFFSDCMGQMKDFDCARLIVEFYEKAGEKDKAAEFVSGCDGMRYKSDQGKLQKMLNR